MTLSTDRAIQRGEEGESRVRAELAQLPGSDYAVVNRLMLRAGKTLSQVDHIVFSRFGVFVIETKNYSGSIYGSRDNEWVQYIGNEKNRFINPILQNEGHIGVLRKITDLKSEVFFNVVVLAGSAVFKSKVSLKEVIFLHDLRKFILSHNREIIPGSLSLQKAKMVCDGNLHDDSDAVEEHKKIVQKAQKNRENARGYNSNRWRRFRKQPRPRLGSHGRGVYRPEGGGHAAIVMILVFLFVVMISNGAPFLVAGGLAGGLYCILWAIKNIGK